MTYKFWNWFRKDAPVAGESVKQPAIPYLTLTVTPDGRLNQFANFPQLPDQEFDEAAKNFALMLFLLNDGRLLSVLQKAVAKGGMASPFADAFSGQVLKNLNDKMAGFNGNKDKNKLLVRPRDVFDATTRNKEGRGE